MKYSHKAEFYYMVVRTAPQSNNELKNHQQSRLKKVAFNLFAISKATEDQAHRLTLVNDLLRVAKLSKRITALN